MWSRWASQYSLGEPVLIGRTGEPSNEVGRASAKGPLGEPVLIGRASWESHQTRLGRASTKGPLGEPVLVGRASTKRPLGEPVLVGRATQLSQWPQWPTPAPAWRSYGARSAPGARSALCLLGTFGCVPARHVPARRIYLLVPARHVPAWHI